MRCTLLLAAICCVVIPVHGQKPAAKPNTKQQSPAKAQTPANTPINIDTVNVNKLNVAEQPNPPNKPEENANKSQSYFRRLIAPENLPNIVLCVVGIAGVYAAIKTLKAIGRQAGIMERQTATMQKQTRAARRSAIAAVANAFAAKRGAAALIASERAWIDGQVTKRQLPGVGVTRCSLSVTNHGKTPAQIIDYHIWHGLLPGEKEAFSRDKLETHFSATDGTLLASAGTRTLMSDFDMDDFFTSAEGVPQSQNPIDIESGAFCVTINYEDVVTQGEKKRTHQTSFVYFYTPMFETLERVAQYNEYT